MVNDTEDKIQDEKNPLLLDEDDVALLKSPPSYNLGEIQVEEDGSVSEIVNVNSDLECDESDSEVKTDPNVFGYTHVPPKKRYNHLETSCRGFELLNDEHVCIVCDIADSFVVPCSGNACPLAVHKKCAEFGCEDTAMPYCPYCWFKDQAPRSIALRTMVVAAAKALVMYGCSKTKSGDMVVAKENINLEECFDNSLPMQLHDNLDQLRELVEQVKLHNLQLEVDIEKVHQNTCAEDSFLIQDQRKRVLWSIEEEDMLTMGVESYATKNKNMSWMKILEMGKGVFHKARTSSNLKDKWRRMMMHM